MRISDWSSDVCSSDLEAEAFHLGVHVQLVKRAVIVVAAALTGAAVAFSGVIGFVGIVAPHLLRLGMGPDHRYLLPGCALLGGIVTVAADMVARTAVAPEVGRAHV